MSTEYKAIALGLGEKDIINKHLSKKLSQMASYRNRLVPLYHMISQEELYDIITENLDDIRQFIKNIEKFIEKN